MPTSGPDILSLALLVTVVLGSLVLHEIAHGYAALKLGDPTAKDRGRLSLNPLKHLDPWGTTVFVLAVTFLGVGFGWAKPVPIDPRNLKDPKRDMAKIAIAGPAMNFALAIVFAVVTVIVGASGGEALPTFLNQSADLDRAGLFVANPLLYVTMIGLVANLVLGIGNLIPIPPLDGSRILYAALPYYWGFRYYQLQRFTIPALVLLPAVLALYLALGSTR